MYKWQAIEDFNGHLYLVILDSNENCKWFKSNYERNPGELIEDINHIDACVNSGLCGTTTHDIDVLYQKLIAKDASAWWVVADQDEIYWDLMQNAALKEFTK